MPKKLTNEVFKQRATLKHNGKYDYSKTDVNNRDEYGKVIVTCLIHGDYRITPHDHLNGRGCKQCGLERIRQSKLGNTKDFINKAIKVHKDKFLYNEVQYVDWKTPVNITCKIHGIFPQIPNNHLQGEGCPYCGKISANIKKTKSTIDFINEANVAHNNKYDYSETDLTQKDKDGKVKIICHIHGIFKQTPDQHINAKEGCPICKASHMETEIRNLLVENNIDFKEQYKFEWLGKQSLDFYLPKYNIGIECQGKQHFEERKYFGGEEGLKIRIERDNRKRKLCHKNNVKLLYYANYQYKFPYDVITDKQCLINQIREII